jgi:hypothetical protein
MLQVNAIPEAAEEEAAPPEPFSTGAAEQLDEVY